MTDAMLNERSADRLVRENPTFANGKSRTRRSALRATLARQRAVAALAALANCKLCTHECGVDRLAGTTGLCHAGAETRIFSAQVEVSDELELIPTFAIAFSGCDLRCDFCITGGPSWNPRLGEALSVETIVARARTALAQGARTVMLLGGEPTVHLHTALEIVAALPDDAKLVWKTNAHGSAQARELLEGMFDVWLADYKFGNDACAQRLAKVSEYNRVVRENLLWFAGKSKRSASDGFLTTKEQRNEEKLGSFVPSLFNPLAGPEAGAPARGELIVRHLLMPGHVECCWRPVAEWLAEHLPGVKVNLRSGFWPAWHAARHPELCGTVSKIESEAAWQIGRECNLNFTK